MFKRSHLSDSVILHLPAIQPLEVVLPVLDLGVRRVETRRTNTGLTFRVLQYTGRGQNDGPTNTHLPNSQKL